jgi:hypothetical protein
MTQFHTRHAHISIQVRDHTRKSRAVCYLVPKLDAIVFGLDEDREPDDVGLVSDVRVVPV